MSRLEGNAGRTARGQITWRSIYKDGAQFSCPWSPFNGVSLKHEPIELRRQTSGAYLCDASLRFQLSPIHVRLLIPRQWRSRHDSYWCLFLAF